MKFFHLINVRWYNATAWYAVRLCYLLKTAGHDVVVGVLPNTDPAKKAKELGLKTLELDYNAKNPLDIKELTKQVDGFLDDFKPDLVVCHRGELFWYFGFKRFFSKPSWKLMRVRGDERKPKNNLFNRFLHNSCSDKIVVTGEFIKRWFIEDLGVEASKISVIYGGVDTKKFTSDLEGRKRVRAEFGFGDDDIVVGLVGRYGKVKGHIYLLEAIKELRSDDKRYKLLLVSNSGGLDIEDLKRVIVGLGLEKVAFVTGFREDVVACINAFDVGVVSSIGSEAISRVAYEIMSCKVPLIATSVGVLPEITPSGNLIPPKDSVSLAKIIKNHSKEVAIFSDEEFLAQYLNSATTKRG